MIINVIRHIWPHEDSTKETRSSTINLETSRPPYHVNPSKCYHLPQLPDYVTIVLKQYSKTCVKRPLSNNSENEQEIQQSQTADKPMASRGRATQPSLYQEDTQKMVFKTDYRLMQVQKYCIMLQREHPVILSTFIKLPVVIKTFVLV